MKLFTKSIEKALVENRAINLKLRGETQDFKPVVKLFGGSNCTWLLTEFDGEECFGLCDLGMGAPEMGYISLTELESLKFPPFGLGVERDKFFEATKTLGEYAEEARMKGRIEA